MATNERRFPARLTVHMADYEGGVLHVCLQKGLRDNLRLCEENVADKGIHEHFERAFWHCASMLQRLEGRA